MKYSESIDWLYSLQQFGVKLGLDNIARLLSALDQPQDQIESILIGGTNGKGSVGAMFQSILSASGYRSGLYTSPHLAKVEERIRFGYDEISCNQLAHSLSKIRSVIEELLNHKALSHHPTFFEVLTAATFEMFARQKIDLAVVEVGMGGRFDATNILHPILSVITNIEKDHTEYLGKTLDRIALEKCGIIRENGFLITGKMKKSPLKMMKKICREKKSSLVDASEDCEFSLNDDGTVTLITPSFQYEKLRIPLLGEHQIENAAVAVRGAEILSEMGFNITPTTISRGICKTKWEGRIEWVRSKPPIILDGAHNVSAMRALSRYLTQLRKENYEIRIIFGAMQDKDIDGMLRVISPTADSIYLTTLDMERAANLDHLYNISLNHHRVVKKCQNLKDALKASSNKTSSKVISIRNKKSLQKPIICVCGSLFLVGAFKSLRARQKDRRHH
jgi:dihydrofolate synthase/folylpolyglutamate synthase